MKSFLNAGCGPLNTAKKIRHFRADTWREVRLDIDPAVSPDIIGTITDMGAVPDQSMDAVYSSNNLEHLYPHEVGIALKEFSRVLRPDGFLVVTCPDLQSICKLVADGKLLETAYVSAKGPIAALDMLYGFRGATQTGNHFMAHRCGFTLPALLGSLREAGFQSAAGLASAPAFELWVVGRKDAMPDPEMIALARRILFDDGSAATHT